jgi:hypothetical protein
MRSGVSDRISIPDPTAAGAGLSPASMARHLCENLGLQRKCSLL